VAVKGGHLQKEVKAMGRRGSRPGQEVNCANHTDIKARGGGWFRTTVSPKLWKGGKNSRRSQNTDSKETNKPAKKRN